MSGTSQPSGSGPGILQKVNIRNAISSIFGGFLFLLFFVGGVYLVVEGESPAEIITGVVLVFGSFPFAFYFLRYAGGLDNHGVLDVMAVYIGILVFIVVLAVFSLIPAAYRTLIKFPVVTVIILGICAVCYFAAYKLADGESFRFGGILMVGAGITAYYAAVALISAALGLV